ncbi:MAG: acyltransferase [Mucilaginibacter sp.]
MKFKKLEALRGFAALYIVVNHVFTFDIVKNSAPAIVRLPFRFGQEAVTMFFLLSGFVIYLSVSRSTTIDFPKYFLKRFVRIYPILIITFIISIVVAFINQHHFVMEDGRTFIGNLFMLQDLDGRPGYFTLPFLENWPLWSLSYEWSFYLLFYPIYVFFIKENTIKISSTYVVLGISMCGWLLYMVFPNHLFLVVAYFSLWWAGVACAQVYLKYKTFTFETLKPVFWSLGVMTIITSVPFIWRLLYGGYLHPIEYPIITFRNYFMSIILILAGLTWWQTKLKGFDALLGWFEKIAPISYGLYVSHYVLLSLNMPAFINPYLAILIRLALAFLTAYLLEIKMQPVFNNLLLKRQGIVK